MSSEANGIFIISEGNGIYSMYLNISSGANTIYYTARERNSKKW